MNTAATDLDKRACVTSSARLASLGRRARSETSSLTTRSGRVVTMRIAVAVVAGLLFLVEGAGPQPVRGDGPAVPLAPGVRGLVTRVSGKLVIDGSLSEWTDAFCTPVQYNHGDVENRAAQFFYLWDDEAFYIGLR